MIAGAAGVFAACQKSLEDQAERDTREYTARHCPQEEKYTILDSMTFDRATRTIAYFYSIKTDEVLLTATQLKEGLLNDLRNQTSIRAYKDAGFAFRYVCHPCNSPDSSIVDVTFRQEDYSH